MNVQLSPSNLDHANYASFVRNAASLVETTTVDIIANKTTSENIKVKGEEPKKTSPKLKKLHRVRIFITMDTDFSQLTNVGGMENSRSAVEKGGNDGH